MTSFIEKRAAARRTRKGKPTRTRKDVLIPVRVDPKKHALWKRDAKAAGMSLTAWVEQGLNAAMRRKKGGST